MVAYVDAMLARLTVRRGQYVDGLAMLEAAMADLRRFGMEAYAELADAWIAEAEAFGRRSDASDGARESAAAGG